jgi:serine/threonine-protein kinase
VEHSSVDAQGELESLSFQLALNDPIDDLPARLAVHIQAQLAAGQLADGDEVEVSGVWDDDTLDADEIRIVTADAPPRERRTSPSVVKRRAQTTKGRRGRTPVFVALAVVIVVTAAAVVWFTDGFGLWNRPGPIIKPVSATVFAPSGSPDNPDKAGLAIDGDPATSWSTVTYTDPVPFPNFVEGQGLMLHLSEAAVLSAVTIDVSSTGTEVQIRSSPTETPATFADTTELTPSTPLQPGHNRIAVDDQTKTSNVLVWITTLGTTNGRSRAEVSEITLQSAG